MREGLGASPDGGQKSDEGAAPQAHLLKLCFP